MGYTLEEVKVWADEYKKCLSFTCVSKIVGKSRKVVYTYLYKYKNELNIRFKKEIIKDMAAKGFKKCNGCGIIKLLCKFKKKNNQCVLCVSKRNKKYREKNKDIISIKNKKYKKDNKEIIRIKNKKYKKDNRKKIRLGSRKYNNEYTKKRLKTDIGFRLIFNSRTRLRKAIGDNYKLGSVVDNLGCSIDCLKKYLESKFYDCLQTKEKMNWNNYGLHGWHIDHIIPLSSFDLTDLEQFKKACHYTNLQPLWAKDNLSKGSKLNWERNNGDS